jgi:hypothetical protein
LNNLLPFDFNEVKVIIDGNLVCPNTNTDGVISHKNITQQFIKVLEEENKKNAGIISTIDGERLLQWLISLSDRMYNLLILVVFVYFMSVIKDLII